MLGNSIHFRENIKECDGKFKTKHNVLYFSSGREFGYFLQGANIVKIVYSKSDGVAFLNNHKNQKYNPLYFYCA